MEIAAVRRGAGRFGLLIAVAALSATFVACAGPAGQPPGASPAVQPLPRNVAAPPRSPGSLAEAIVAPETQSAGQPLDVSEVPVGLAVGMRAPGFTATLLDGSPITDADLRAQGKPYILYFYATW